MATESRVTDPLPAGDESAFVQIFDRYHPLVYGIALRMLNNPRAAEDIVQDVYMKVWANPGAFRGGDLAAWLSRVTRNRALDVMRLSSERPKAELPVELADDTSSVVDEVFARIDRAAVRRAVAALEPAFRELLLPAFFGGLTHIELARRSGLPLGTVKTRLRSALRQLHLELASDIVQETYGKRRGTTRAPARRRISVTADRIAAR